MNQIATRQHGVVSRRQLVELGISEDSIDRQLVTGRLALIHRGVYAVGHTARALHTREMAALLACGIDRSTLSHTSAARVWRMLPPDTRDKGVDISVWNGQPRYKGIRIHRPLDLGDSDCRWHGPIRITSPIRTLLDIARSRQASCLDSAVNEALILGVVKDHELERLVLDSPSRRGICLLERQLVDKGYTRSAAEEKMRKLIKAHGLPPAIANTHVAGYEVDFLWPGFDVIVEVDGFKFHRTRLKSDRDTLKTGSLQDAGYTVIRVNWTLISESPDKVAGWIRSAIAAKSTA